MFTSRRIAVPFVVIVLSFASFAADGDKPVTAEILPDGTIMYAEIAPCAQWSKDFSKTSLAQIASEPEVKQFLAGPFSQISTLIKKAMPPAPAPAEPVKPTEPSPVTNAFNAVLDTLGQFTPG